MALLSPIRSSTAPLLRRIARAAVACRKNFALKQKLVSLYGPVFSIARKKRRFGVAAAACGRSGSVVFEAGSPFSPPLGPLFLLHLGAAPVE
jgi:hypothetical protein